MFITYLILIFSSLITLATFWASNPQKRFWMKIAIVFICVNIGFQIYSMWIEQKTNQEVRRFACGKLIEANSDFLRYFAWAVHRSSSGWLPTNEDELFSERVTVQVYQCLNKGIIHWHASGINNGSASD